MSIYTTADLLTSIRKKAFVPSSQETFTTEDLLALATEEMNNVVVPKIAKVREEVFVRRDSYALTAQDRAIAIPPRAAGLGLREVSLVIGDSEWNLPRMDLEDRVYNIDPGPNQGFYLQDHTLNFLGSQTGDIFVYYLLRPGRLIETSAAGQVQSVDTSTNEVVVNNLPSEWTTSTEFDVVYQKPGFSTRGLDLAVTGIDTPTKTLTFSELPTDENGDISIEVGHWVCEADTSPVPQIPPEFFSYLAQSTAVQVLESLGDADAAKMAMQRLEIIERNVMNLLSPRVQGANKKLTPPRNRGWHFSRFWGNNH
jgi:hypothetical protein